MRRGVCVVGLLGAALAGCGQGTDPPADAAAITSTPPTAVTTVVDLRQAAVEAGLPCEDFRIRTPYELSQAEYDQNAAEAGICQTGFGGSYSLAVYDSPTDRGHALTAYTGIGFGCTVYGDRWSSWWSGETPSERQFQEKLADYLGGDRRCA